MAEGGNYVKMIVYVFIALGALIGAILTAYFGSVGLFFGQSVVEGDVFTGAYKYQCGNSSQTASTCTNITATQTQAYTDYAEVRTDLNDQIPLYIAAIAIVFSLLSLVFLFLALRESGLMSRKKENKNMY